MPAGRPKKPDKRLQGDFNDIPVEDLELAEMIDLYIELEGEAKRFRQVSAAIKTRIDDNYSEHINSDVGGIHSGWLNVLGRRVYVGKIDVAEKEVPATIRSASRRWVGLDAHRRDMFDAVAEGS